MKAPHLALAVIGVLAVMGLAVASDEKPNKDKTPKEPPIVKVARPIQQQVTAYAEFNGRTNANMSIEIKPRVSGFVTKVAVKNAAEVKKDELLFEIDPKAYRADLDVAKADCVLAEAELEFARVTLARIVTLAKQKAVSMEELDQAKAQELRVAASLAKARAKLEMARLNLDYTTIRAPMNGVVRGLIDSGNLAIADQTDRK